MNFARIPRGGGHENQLRTQFAHVWDDVTRQIVGVVSADALIVSQFTSVAPIGISAPVMENEDQTVLSGPVAGDRDD
ncbi:MAG: hypothetical protein EBT47_10820 [Chloroflexi bacterium]|nr:hypothetical protein [Chloroflexota bacterium]